MHYVSQQLITSEQVKDNEGQTIELDKKYEVPWGVPAARSMVEWLSDSQPAEAGSVPVLELPVAWLVSWYWKRAQLFYRFRHACQVADAQFMDVFLDT